MRILTVLHDLSAGGTERVALSLAAAWRDAGADSIVLVGCAQGPLAVPGGVEWQEVVPPMPRSPLSRVRLWRGLARSVAAISPDVLFLPGNWHFLLAHGVAAARPRPLIVGKLSNPPVPGGAIAPAAGLLFRAITAPIDAIVAWPEAAARKVERLVPGKPVVRVRNPPLGHAVRNRDPGHGSTGRVLMAGRLVPQKDVGLAIAAFRDALAFRPGLSLEIVGDGPERPRLEAIARGLPVRFHGHVQDLAPHFASADSLLLTSRFEGTPSVVIEALAAGVPVVATDCSPFVAEMLDGPGRGRLVKRRSAPALARALLETLDCPAPMPGIEEALAPFRTGAIAVRYLALFEALLSGAG